MLVKKIVTNFAIGSSVNSDILSGPNADNGGYKFQPPVKNFENILVEKVNAITSVKPLMISIQFENVRRNDLRNSFIK